MRTAPPTSRSSTWPRCGPSRVWRSSGPADGNETAYAWQATLDKQSVFASGPVGLALTRQNVPTLEGTTAEGVASGGYVLADADGDLQVILMATGSEVQLAVKARELLQAEGIGTRVVSVPCLDWFEAQDAAYIESVLPAAVTARVSVEAGVAQPWWRWLGSAGRPVSLEHYGASADAATLFREFGFTPEHVVAAAKESLAAAGKPAEHQHRAEHRALQHVGVDTGTATESGTAERLTPSEPTRDHRPADRPERRTPPSPAARKSHHDHTAEHQQPACRSRPPPGFPCGWTTCPGSGCSPAT